MLNHALFVLNYLTMDRDGKSAADRLWHPHTSYDYAQALWKYPLTFQWQGPDPVLIWGRGSACVYDTSTGNARWLPECLVKPFNPLRDDNPEKGHNCA